MTIRTQMGKKKLKYCPFCGADIDIELDEQNQTQQARQGNRE